MTAAPAVPPGWPWRLSRESASRDSICSIHQRADRQSGSPLSLVSVHLQGHGRGRGRNACSPLALDCPRVALGAAAGFLDITASALFIYASQHG